VSPLMKSSVISVSGRPNAQEKYSEFVQAGIGNPLIWDDLDGRSLLGVEGFADGLRHLVTETQQIREILKGQRFVGRPNLGKLFHREARQSIQGAFHHQSCYSARL
jgi:hypothetical protein